MYMPTDMQAAAAIPLLASLGENGLRQALDSGAFQPRSYRKGQLVHAEGEPCLGLEVILSGQLAVERLTPEGDLMTIAVFGPGDCLGGNLLFSSRPVYQLAVTASGHTRVLAIARQPLFDLFQRHSAFLAQYLAYVSDNAGLLEEKLRHFANLPIRQRVLNYLHAQAARQGGRRVLLPVSKTALAEQFGVQRTSLSRELQKMRDQGLIAFDRQSITLL